MSCVRPGVLLVRARSRRPVMALSALDLPAFERPANATSTPSSGGNWAGCQALVRNVASGNCGMGDGGPAKCLVYNSAPFGLAAALRDPLSRVTCGTRTKSDGVCTMKFQSRRVAMLAPLSAPLLALAL